jgi:uncharacterized protein (DUF488 family)
MRRVVGVQLFTIGFTKKSAAEFFGLLRDAGVKRVVDVRLNNVSQLAGFSKKDDLAFFLSAIAGIDYLHAPILAPDQSLIDDYRTHGIGYDAFAAKFAALLKQRKVETLPEAKLRDGDCLLCSEVQASECHRSVVASYLSPFLKRLTVRDL